MEVGDLVIYRNDGDIGVIMDCDRTGMAYVHWTNDMEGWHIASELEVINE